MKCIWSDCPGFKWNNQTCFMLAPNQTLPIATQSNGTSIFIRDDLIQKVESVIAYNGETFHEFIPSTSPLKGFLMTFPDPPTSPHQVLMDFVWGFHICNTLERSCHRWYFGTDKWIPMPDLNFPHAEVRDMIRVNQTWWIFGGYGEKQSPDNTNYPNQLCEYLDDRDRWNQGPKYLIRYLEGIGVISDSVVMAVGGAHTPKNYNSFIISVTEFDIVKGFLGHRFSLSRRMFGVTCGNFVALNGTKLILCLGGTYSQSEPQFSNETYVYNLETGGWMEMPEWQVPEPVSFSNLAWFQGNLYVIGARYGESDRNTVYRFDETTQPAWTVVDMLPDHPEEYSRVRTFTRSLVIF
ncbi:uncharacterized protein LOC131879273 [Tigriopus californicus]|uniref:uncharacterized protein LOC131879273 n=1 Tax=Tigriopus californicus TaxID=6832 RepID=UPI0027DA9C12|nr:uncharacterized protein LOC131879273 [Tigriopus californicus]